MKKCILVDRSKTKSEKLLNNNFYTKDIIEIELDHKDLPTKEEIKSSPFSEPVPFYYNLVPKKYKKLQKLIGADLLHWSFVKYYNVPGTLIMISATGGSWDYASAIKMLRMFKYGNPKAIFINKRHYVWSNAIFYYIEGDLTRKDFIKDIYNTGYMKKESLKYKPSFTPSNEDERRKVALEFLEHLVKEYYLTLESAYILWASQLNYEYIRGGYHFFQSSNSFHVHYECCTHLIQLCIGSKGHDEKYPGYMWNILAVPLLKCENFDIHNDKMKKHVTEYGLKFIDPIKGHIQDAASCTHVEPKKKNVPKYKKYGRKKR